MLEGDLVNKVKPGDDVVLGGLLVRRWKQTGKQNKLDITLWIDCKFLQTNY